MEARPADENKGSVALNILLESMRYDSQVFNLPWSFRRVTEWWLIFVEYTQRIFKKYIPKSIQTCELYLEHSTSEKEREHNNDNTQDWYELNLCLKFLTLLTSFDKSVTHCH